LPGGVERLAPAKINLALHVLGRRADGYHELDTLAVFADVGDRLWLRHADDFDLSVAGRFARQLPESGENLVVRAARLLKERTGQAGGAAIRLEKNLPSGAGFGGGSADAAATLLGLDALWQLGLGTDGLLPIAALLGSDVPMCLMGRALRARGRGERLAPIRGWPVLPMVLVWPDRPLATAAVFAGLRLPDHQPLGEAPSAASPTALAAWLASCRNDLEASAIELAPEVGAALDGLRTAPGCLLARMSGSGSGCFGLFGTRQQAEAVTRDLSQSMTRWWVAAVLAG
jgi:4-diphosphocytidyl-2-C-methyl-D-erythritol kinase